MTEVEGFVRGLTEKEKRERRKKFMYGSDLTTLDDLE